MSLVPLFEALGRSAPGLFLRASTPAFAATEAIHLIALSLVGGIVTVVLLATAGILLARPDAPSLAKALRPLMIGALATVIVTGGMLVAAGPFKYYTNPVFWWKMALLILAIAGYATVDRRLVAAGGSPALPSIRWRVGAVALLPLWLSVAIAGRMIGLI